MFVNMKTKQRIKLNIYFQHQESELIIRSKYFRILQRILPNDLLQMIKYKCCFFIVFRRGSNLYFFVRKQKVETSGYDEDIYFHTKCSNLLFIFLDKQYTHLYKQYTRAYYITLFLLQQALKTVLQATKCSNELPATGDDFDYYSSFQGVRDVLDIEGNRILNMFV